MNSPVWLLIGFVLVPLFGCAQTGSTDGLNDLLARCRLSDHQRSWTREILSRHDGQRLVTLYRPTGWTRYQLRERRTEGGRLICTDYDEDRPDGTVAYELAADGSVRASFDNLYALIASRVRFGPAVDGADLCETSTLALGERYGLAVEWGKAHLTEMAISDVYRWRQARAKGRTNVDGDMAFLLADSLESTTAWIVIAVEYFDFLCTTVYEDQPTQGGAARAAGQ